MEAGQLSEGKPGAVGAGVDLTEIDPIAIRGRSPWELFWKRFREDRPDGPLAWRRCDDRESPTWS